MERILYDHAFGAKSLANLEGVLPHLIQLAKLAIRFCEYDGTILPTGGLRTEAQAQDNVRRGTGILYSRHIKQADGFGHAIDLVALTPGKGVDWKNIPAFMAMAEAVKDAAAELNIVIRQGCDWDMDGKLREVGEYDLAHFEDPKQAHLNKAIALLERHREELGLNFGEPPTLVDEVALNRAALGLDKQATCPHCKKPIKLVAG